MTGVYSNLEGTGLREIFSMQANTMEKFFNKGQLPPYPLEWKTYDDQYIMRDYLGYMQEEVAEFLDAYRILCETLFNNSPAWIDNNQMTLHDMRKDIITEVADILAFNTELLIFAGINTRDIHSYMKEICKNHKLNNIIRDDASDILEDLFSFGNYFNITTGLLRTPQTSITLIEEKTQNYPVNRFSHVNLLCVENLVLNHFMDSLKTRMPMKAKPWRENPPKMSLSAVIRPLLDSYLTLFRLAGFLGFDKWSIVEIFKEKQNILKTRQENNY